MARELYVGQTKNRALRLSQNTNAACDMGYRKVSVILERDFYSGENINALLKNHQKFIIGVTIGLNYVSNAIE